MKSGILWLITGALVIYWVYFEKGGKAIKDKTAGKDKPGQTYWDDPFGNINLFGGPARGAPTDYVTKAAQDSVIRSQRNYVEANTVIGVSDPGTPAGGNDYLSQMIQDSNKPYESATLGLSVQSNADPNTPFASPLDYIATYGKEPLNSTPSNSGPGVMGFSS